jgi:thiol-disulfide isomerase/thioredoxin
MIANQHVDALDVLAECYEARGERDRAHTILWQASDYLASKAPARDETNKQVLNWYTLSRYFLLRVTAELAEREGRKLDALNGYREALAVRPIGREEMLGRQRKLWQQLGGTNEGWQQWTNPVAVAAVSKAEPADGSRPNRSLPPLAVKDLQGSSWTLDRLAAKTTIAIVWATWCEPCRAELPYFAKLAERVKGRDDVLAVSFNIDDNIALAADFARSKGYTFPVLAARQYAEGLMPVFAVPRTWIIRNGEIAREYQGFGKDGDKWVEEMLAALQ